MSTLSGRTRLTAKIAVSLALVTGLFYFLDTASLATALTSIEVGYLLLAFLMVVGNRILMPLKWNLLLRASGVGLPDFLAIRLYTIASFLGLVLPPTVGADSVRSYYMKQRGINLSDAVASIAIERVFGLIILLAFTVAGFFLLVHQFRDGEIPITAFESALANLHEVPIDLCTPIKDTAKIKGC